MFGFLRGDGGAQPAEPSMAEVIESNVERIMTATMLDDRRAAVRNLKTFSKQAQVEVGNQAMHALVGVFQNDRADTEIVNSALETLTNVMTAKTFNQDKEPLESDTGVIFTEIFVKNPESVKLLLSLLQEVDLYVRLNTVKLLTTLLTNRPQALQNAVMTDPLGVPSLMDLLSDSREIIRNEGLLLMIELTKSNTAIQKIVAFENAFEKLSEIIREEGASEGGIIVADCARLLGNLLNGNTSNQNYYRETSNIAFLNFFFDFEMSNADGSPISWQAQKVSNVLLMLKVVRYLVEPGNAADIVTNNQNATRTTGLLATLAKLVFTYGCPEDVLIEAFATLAEMIRGNKANQDFFSKLLTPNNTSPLVYLLYCVFGQQPSLSVRTAALYCFQGYLHKHTDGQNTIASSLLPGQQVQGHSAGPLLCQALLTPKDPMINWFAGTAFAHVLNANLNCKETLLRVSIAREAGKVESLLSVCLSVLSQTKESDDRRRVAYFTVLLAWMFESVAAVKTFLQTPDGINFLVPLIGGQNARGNILVEGLASLLLGVCVVNNDDTDPKWNKSAVREVIKHRIGESHFLGRIDRFLKADDLTRMSKAPQITETDPDKVWFDMEVVSLLQKIADTIQNYMKGNGQGSHAQESRGPQNAASVDYHETVVQQYKDMIRQQDQMIQQLTTEVKGLKASAASAPSVSSAEADALKARVASLEAALAAKDTSASSAQLLHSKDEEIARLAAALQQAEAKAATSDAELTTMRADAHHLHEQVFSLEEASRASQQIIAQLEAEKVALAERAAADNQLLVQERAKNVAITESFKKVEGDLSTTTKEHEDLLILLAEQQQTIDDYRKRLKALGQEVSENEEEEEEEEEGEDN